MDHEGQWRPPLDNADEATGMIYEERDAEIRRAWMEECWAAIGGRSVLDLEQETHVPVNLLHAFSSHGERPEPQHVVMLARATQGAQWAPWAHRVLRLLNYEEIHVMLALKEAYQPAGLARM